MNYTEVLQQIKLGKILPVYLLYGEEAYLMRHLEKQIIDALLTPDEREMNLTVLDHDPETKELVNLIETVPFMGGKNVIVIRGTALFKSRGGPGEPGAADIDEQLLATLDNMPEYSHVVFSSTDKADKRRKIYKTVEKNGAAVELAPLKAGEIRPWLSARLAEKGKKMDSDAVEYLMGVISVMQQISLGFLESEIEKLSLYTGERNTITYDDLTAVFSSMPEVSVFAMIDALSQKHTVKALELINQQLAAGEHPLRLLALLSRQVRMLWQAKEMHSIGHDGRRIAAMLGVPPFVGEKMIRQSKNFTADRLKNALLALANADYDYKSGHADNIVLENIIIEMCR